MYLYLYIYLCTKNHKLKVWAPNWGLFIPCLGGALKYEPVFWNGIYGFQIAGPDWGPMVSTLELWYVQVGRLPGCSEGTY